MKSIIRVYLPFCLNELKRQLAYKGAFYLFIFISLFSSFINYYLWMAIYGNSTNATLGGLTKEQIVVYIFMVYVTMSTVSISISGWISDDIIKGTVSMNLIKPIDYRASLISRAIGQSLYRFLMPGIFIWIGIEIYKVTVFGMPFTSITNILCYILSILMSFFIYVLFDFCFGMIAFFTTYIFGLSLVKAAVLTFLTGELIPLSFFPEIVQKIFSFLPFSSMVYTPVMIYMGKYSGNELVFILLRQLFWVVLLYIVGSLVWKKVTKHLIVLGG